MIFTMIFTAHVDNFSENLLTLYVINRMFVKNLKRLLKYD